MELYERTDGVEGGTLMGHVGARELSVAERQERWDRAVAAYPPYADYAERTDRQMPVLVLERQG